MYVFPTTKLSAHRSYPDREPLILVSCGSFSPITYLHLRMFEMAADFIRDGTRFELLGGYFSPVNQKYGKKGLAPAIDRVEMCRRAVDGSDWLMVDDWEASQTSYQPSAAVLDHFEEEIRRLNFPFRVRIMLLAGGDLIQSFSTPGLWASADLHHILGNCGCFVIERTGTDVWGFLLSHDILYSHRSNVFVVKQLIYNDISSTKVRLFIRRNMSIRYLVPDAVAQYIYEKQLYRSDSTDEIPVGVRNVVPSISSAPSSPDIVSSKSEEEESPTYINVAQITAESDEQPPPLFLKH